MGERTCDVCGDAWYARDWCRFHYDRWYRTGDPGAGTPKEVHGKDRVCAFAGCGRKHAALGYCKPHWQQLKDGKELKPLRPTWGDTECTAAAACHNPVLAQGYCRRHYQAWQRYGDPLISLKPVRGQCSFPGCGRPHDSHGYCTSHARQLRGGRAVTELLPLTIRSPQVREDLAAHVVRHATRAGVYRRYALDETYFDEITDERRAYWLGFITADGGITAGKAHCLKVELASRDEGHLIQMRADLGSDRPLAYNRGCVCASFGSRYLVESLGALGIGPRKGATVEPWDGPADLMPHYWRGLFDGDGSIFQVTTSRCWTTGICGSRACVEAFAAWAKEITGSTATPRQVRDTACWTWSVVGGPKPQLLARALYADATIALPRKKERADLLCAQDYDAAKVAANSKRSASMQESWSTGRHPRSRRAA
jgi:hypothetical protein